MTLIERLRGGRVGCDCVSCEAADEIERLTASNNRLHVNGTADQHKMDDMQMEIKRLRAALAEITTESGISYAYEIASEALKSEVSY